jgi:plasmid stability protein
MPSVSIRNLDDAIIEALKRRAARNHRSLEGELRQILTEAAFPRSSGDGRRRRLKLKLKTVAVGAKTSYRREEIYGSDES